jgi:hypothetical protein
VHNDICQKRINYMQKGKKEYKVFIEIKSRSYSQFACERNTKDWMSFEGFEMCFSNKTSLESKRHKKNIYRLKDTYRRHFF